MRIPFETLFAFLVRKSTSIFLQPLVDAEIDSKSSIHKSFPIQPFDSPNEKLFWQECQSEALVTLKIALVLGAMGFMVSIIFQTLSQEFTHREHLSHYPMALILLLFLLALHRNPLPHTQISRIAKLGSGLFLTNLSGNLLIEGNPEFYLETWTGLLPIYFFTYGQLFMTLAETLFLGLLAMLIMPLSGYLIGVETSVLISSALILLTVNLFGLSTRFQLENHARQSFMARRKTEANTETNTMFLMQLSHNLRQPLQALSCYSSTLNAACMDNSVDRMQYIIHRMGTTIDELNNAINHVLEISNLEIGHHPPLLKNVDINVLLSSLEDRFVAQAAKRGLKLKVCLRRAPPYNVYSDAVMLSQIISNLIDNAIKYTSKGWIAVGVNYIGANRLKLHVCDSGIGIPAEMQSEIFKEFVRGNRRQNDTDAPGMGMGLAYVAKATNYLPNHDLKVYSRQDRGSDFQLYLPAIQAKPPIDVSPSQGTVLSRFILLVDSDPQVLNAMTEQLRSWDCRVQTATCKAEIQAALADNLIMPDMLICEYHLDNGESFFDILACIEAECGPVPTLILSAQAIPDTEKAKFPHYIKVLRKPANAKNLMASMMQLLEKQPI